MVPYKIQRGINKTRDKLFLKLLLRTIKESNEANSPGNLANFTIKNGNKCNRIYFCTEVFYEVS